MPGGSKTGPSKPSVENQELSVEGLLGRVVERDLEALERLYERFAPRLLGLLLRILPARSDAESALEEVFLRLWKEAPGITRAKGSVAAWLVLMARHEGLARLRAQRLGEILPAPNHRGHGHSKEEKPGGKSAEAAPHEHKSREHPLTNYDSQTSSFLAASPELWMPRPEDIDLVDARLGLLQRAFDQMPKPQRRALELVIFEAYTESEVAVKLGEPLGKVNAGLRAALTFLRHRQHAVLGTWTADI